MRTALRQLLRSRASRRIALAYTTWAAMFRNGVGKKVIMVKSADEAHPGRIQQRMLFLLLTNSSSLRRSNVRYSSAFAACSRGQLRRQITEQNNYGTIGLFSLQSTPTRQNGRNLLI